MMSLWELSGHTLTITPTVAKELPRVVGRAERERWQKTIHREHDRSDHACPHHVTADILSDTDSTASRWISREIQSPATGIAQAPETTDLNNQSMDIALTLPANCFNPSHSDSQFNDRIIISQAIVLGFTLLASENLYSIFHDRLNDWLLQNGYTSTPLIVRAENILPAFSGNEYPPETALSACLGACLPENDQGLENDLTLVNRYIDVLTRSHASACARLALAALEATRDIRERVATARQNLPHRARATERRRLEATSRAARSAGYRRP